MPSLEADRIRWAARLAAKQCGRCGRDLPAGWEKTSCATCGAAVAEAMRKTWWRKRGIVPPPKGGRPTLGQRRLAAEFATR